MKFYTYIFRDPTRDMEPFYVGKGKDGRVWKKKNKQVENRRRKIIELENKLEVELIYAIDESHAKFMEECIISVIGTKPIVNTIKRGPLWNFTKGGEGTAGMTPWNKGKKLGPTGKKKPHTLETKLKISIANSGKKRQPHTLETINKISVAKLNKPRSEETKQKISNSLSGYGKGIPRGPASEEHKMNMSKSRKGIPWTTARRNAQRKRDDKE
jgi:hypothetical protein